MFSFLSRQDRDRIETRHHRPRLCLENLEDRTLPASLLPGFAESGFSLGLAQPTSMEFAPDGRLFVTEKSGAVRIIQANGQLLATPLLNVNVDSSSERGLNGITFDPDFSTNGRIYIYYTTSGTPVNRLSRFTVSGNSTVGGEQILIDNIPSTNGNHNGGGLHFGNDGMLYVAIGEAGVPANSQDLNTLAGKILRVDVRGANLVIPPDNPFLGQGRGEIWALGFRNPFTFNVDRTTGRIFINDVGAATFEEINQLVRGGNYGWPNAEGPSNNPAFTNPVTFYAHGSGAAIAGGVFSRGTGFPASLQGGYFFADFIQGFVRYLTPGSSQQVGFASNVNSPVDLDIGPDGRLYILSIGAGTVTAVRFAGLGQQIVAAPASGSGTVRIFGTNGVLQKSFMPYPGFSGGIRVARGDVNGDGFADIITGTAPGPLGGHVKVFDGVSLATVASFLAFPGYNGGIEVSAGDVNRDGFAEVIVGTSSLSSHVKAFDLQARGVLVRSFLAFAGFGGGVRVAAGDVNRDGFAELIVAAGPGGNGHVKVFSGQNQAMLASFLAYPGATLPQSVWVGAGDIDHDGFVEVITGTGSGAPSHVKAFTIPGFRLRASFLAYPGFTGGVRVSSADVDGDGDDDILTAPSVGPPHIKAFDARSLATLRSFFAFAPTLHMGLSIAGG